MDISIRQAAETDVPSICQIYNIYVRESIATFDLEDKNPADYLTEFRNIIDRFPYFVAEDNKTGALAGYAYANTWKTRKAYDRCVESSVYLHPDYFGKGIGSKLYGELLGRLRKMKMHSVIGGISLPNEASVKLHEKMGFAKIAQFREVGWKFNKWIDVGYWELIFTES